MLSGIIQQSPSSKIIVIFQLCKGMSVCKRVKWADAYVAQFGMSQLVYQNDCMRVIVRSVKDSRRVRLV